MDISMDICMDICMEISMDTSVDTSIDIFIDISVDISIDILEIFVNAVGRWDHFKGVVQCQRTIPKRGHAWMRPTQRPPLQFGN